MRQGCLQDYILLNILLNQFCSFYFLMFAQIRKKNFLLRFGFVAKDANHFESFAMLIGGDLPAFRITQCLQLQEQADQVTIYLWPAALKIKYFQTPK